MELTEPDIQAYAGQRRKMVEEQILGRGIKNLSVEMIRWDMVNTLKLWKKVKRKLIVGLYILMI